MTTMNMILVYSISIITGNVGYWF